MPAVVQDNRPSAVDSEPQKRTAITNCHALNIEHGLQASTIITNTIDLSKRDFRNFIFNISINELSMTKNE